MHVQKLKELPEGWFVSADSKGLAEKSGVYGDEWRVTEIVIPRGRYHKITEKARKKSGRRQKVGSLRVRILENSPLFVGERMAARHTVSVVKYLSLKSLHLTPFFGRESKLPGPI